MDRAEVIDTPHSYARTAKKKRILRIFGGLIDEVKDRVEENRVVEDRNQELDKQITGGNWSKSANRRSLTNHAHRSHGRCGRSMCDGLVFR